MQQKYREQNILMADFALLFRGRPDQIDFAHDEKYNVQQYFPGLRKTLSSIHPFLYLLHLQMGTAGKSETTSTFPDSAQRLIIMQIAFIA